MFITSYNDRSATLKLIRSHLDACLKATGEILRGDGFSRNSIEYLEINDIENMLCRVSDCVKSADINNDMNAGRFEGGKD